MPDQTQRTIADLVFVGFNSRVIAMDRYTGETVWTWKSPKGSGYAAILVDGDRVIVSIMGYMYCLDPIFGQEVWSNPLSGMGVGVPCLASSHGSTNEYSASADAAAKAQAARTATTGA